MDSLINYQLGESTFMFRGVRSDFYISFFSLKFLCANRIAPDGTPHSAASHLGLYCLPMSHKTLISHLNLGTTTLTFDTIFHSLEFCSFHFGSIFLTTVKLVPSEVTLYRTIVLSQADGNLSLWKYESSHEKTNNSDFRLGQTQPGLYSHRRRLEP